MENIDTCLVVCIKNSTECFVKTWASIEDLKKNVRSGLFDKVYSNYYLFESIKGVSNGRLIQKIENWLPSARPLQQAGLPQQYRICLWVQDCSENDVIEYQYLALMLQHMENVICYIYPDNPSRNYECYNKISSYFSFFILNRAYQNRIWVAKKEKDGNGIANLSYGHNLYSNMYKVMPVLEFILDGKDSDFSLKKWTRTVEELFEGVKQGQEIRDWESRAMIDAKLRYLKDKKKKLSNCGAELVEEIALWENKKNRWREWMRGDNDAQVLYRCIDYFTASVSSKSYKEAESYRELFWTKEMQQILKKISVLSLYLLCLQLYYIKNETQEKSIILTAEEIRLLLISIQEISAGMIQLIENLHHGSEKCGLLSIRIHRKDNKKDGNYLYQNYKHFCDRTESGYIFEFRILDYSQKSILESFCEKQYYGKTEDDISIKNFFEYNEDNNFWQKYNENPRNLIHHYGLQIFSTIISNNGGYFEVVSSSKREIECTREVYRNKRTEKEICGMHIPGTEYIGLLPMMLKTAPINPAVEADIHYEFDLRNQYKVSLFDLSKRYQQIDTVSELGLGGQEIKEQIIEQLKDSLCSYLREKEQKEQKDIVLLLTAGHWGELKTEIFCKALILCLIEWKPRNGQGFYTIIRDCDANDFITITRMFAIFYGKGKLNTYMEKLQIYLSGKNRSEEFLIAGGNISAFMTIARKLSLVRGIQPACIKSIEYILEKYSGDHLQDEVNGQGLRLVPFDVLQMPEEFQKTLFQEAVKSVLESDLQKNSFGCRINNTHMRIGSKLHIKEFYEAELLFHNNYYVARFALLIIRYLDKIMSKDTPTMFVGYETYSELLLYEIVSHYKDEGFECSYMIYEQGREEKFRYSDSPDYIKEKEKLQFVLIVPINSSMTTHSKLRAMLIAEIEKIRSDYQLNIVANYALILIRSQEENKECDEMEKKYCLSMKNGIIKTAYLPSEENEIRYFVCVNTKWYHPLKCKLCFPEDSMLDEEPLIETNRASVIPVQMLGIQEPSVFKREELSEEEKAEKGLVNMERIQKLSESLVYRHIVRKGNHFMYYFLLEKYFMQNRQDIIEWLKKLKAEKKPVKQIVYDIIVAPLHHSNAGFVAEVNHYLYKNAALVLNFEIEKEFRDNVKTKYSNIVGLYKKLLETGNEAELRFHFVDDMINTSSTFYRAKSLFTSLIPQLPDNKIKVSIFADVIVLLNRMSKSSIMNCVENIENYDAYVNLNISSMRNHEDACTLCKIVENARRLRDQSATNEMYEFWDKKIVRHQIITEEEYLEDEEDERKKQRAQRRMLCNHIANERLSALGYKKNDKMEVKKMMLQLMEEKSGYEDTIEWIISYIKIFSRPFVSFRKSNREAIFQIMLQLLEFITNELWKDMPQSHKTRLKKYTDCKNLCMDIWSAKNEYRQDEEIIALVLTLMQRLSELGSNYTIRKKNIKKIFEIMKSMNITSKSGEDFIKRYAGIVKRIVSLSSDENKCIYLEYLILFGEEYVNEKEEQEKIGESLPKTFGLSCDKQFLNGIFLENTRVLYDGIKDLADELGNDISEQSLFEILNKKYYYENFVTILRYYHILKKTEEGEEFEEGKSQKIIALIRLYCMLFKRKMDVEAFYNTLLEYAELITGANVARLLFFFEKDVNFQGISSDVKKKIYKKERNKDIVWDDFVDYKDVLYQYDTYSIIEEKKKVLIEYKNYVGEGYSVKNRNPLQGVFLELEFDEKKTDLEVMIAIKFIMTFRGLLVENLEKDFSNNLMQKWSAEQELKRNMKLERASDHTDKDELAFTLETVSKGEKTSGEYEKLLYYLVLNSYIARINVQLLTDALPEGEGEEYGFEFVYKMQLKDLIKKMKKFEEFKIVDKQGNEGISQDILRSRIRMYRGQGRNERLTVRRLSIIITELIHSAVKYSDDQVVYIYREDEYFVVRNSFESDREIDVIRKEAQDAYSRKKEGISLAVIKELVDKFYCLRAEDGVIIDAVEEGQKKFYYVKLPILVVERTECDE